MDENIQKAGEVRFISATEVPSLAERERLLTREGEVAVELADWDEARKAGLVTVALIWHGAQGSWREERGERQRSAAGV